jgi:hypothetical protein
MVLWLRKGTGDGKRFTFCEWLPGRYSMTFHLFYGTIILMKTHDIN